jgi:hypothetical protein
MRTRLHPLHIKLFAYKLVGSPRTVRGPNESCGSRDLKLDHYPKTVEVGLAQAFVIRDERRSAPD